MSTAPSSHALAVDRFCSGELHHASCALLGKPVLTREQTVAAPPGVATLVEGVVFWSRSFATCSLPGLCVGNFGEVRAKAQAPAGVVSLLEGVALHCYSCSSQVRCTAHDQQYWFRGEIPPMMAPLVSFSLLKAS
jgi:hypothetical protein